jgi:predicted HTH domain antitoxin
MDELAAVRQAANKRRQWAERLENSIIAAYQLPAGNSLNALAEASGLSVEGVRKLLRRRGIELRPPHVR